jgi:hypothetical protein
MHGVLGHDGLDPLGITATLLLACGLAAAGVQLASLDGRSDDLALALGTQTQSVSLTGVVLAYAGALLPLLLIVTHLPIATARLAGSRSPTPVATSATLPVRTCPPTPMGTYGRANCLKRPLAWSPAPRRR